MSGMAFRSLSGRARPGLQFFPCANHPTGAGKPPPVRMRHFAFRADRANFLQAQRELKERGIDFEFEDHEIAHSIYFRDPGRLRPRDHDLRTRGVRGRATSQETAPFAWGTAKGKTGGILRDAALEKARVSRRHVILRRGRAGGLRADAATCRRTLPCNGRRARSAESSLCIFSPLRSRSCGEDLQFLRGNDRARTDLSGFPGRRKAPGSRPTSPRMSSGKSRCRSDSSISRSAR